MLCRGSFRRVSNDLFFGRAHDATLAPYGYVECTILFESLRGYGNRPLGFHGRCYSVCGPVVCMPGDHDSYSDSAKEGTPKTTDSPIESVSVVKNVSESPVGRSKPSKKVSKRIRSIERLYRPSIEKEQKLLPKNPSNISSLDCIPMGCEDAHQGHSVEYQPTKNLVKSIYRSATNGIFNDTLWKRYVQQLSIVAGILHPADLCLVLYSFAKVRFRDKHLFNVISPLIARSIDKISCGGLALIMNALKRLEICNYDLIDLVTNQVCANMDKANVQDISLTANSLAYFQIYHLRFWNALYNALAMRHYQISPLQAALLLAAFSKLDIRNPRILRILKRRLRPAIEQNKLSQELLTLVFHSFAKLDFDSKHFYAACIKSFEKILAEDPKSIDTQSIVLFLYTSVCILDVSFETIEKSLRLLLTRGDFLKNYKAIKLKYVVDHLKYKQKEFVDRVDYDLKEFMDEIMKFKLTNMPRRFSRWAFEVSMILKNNGVKHKKNVLFNYIYGDIYLKEYGIIVKCAGPYSYYTRSTRMTMFSRIEKSTLLMKGFKVCVLPYYEWNRLKTEEDKIKYLNKFGEEWASVFFPTTEQTVSATLRS